MTCLNDEFYLIDLYIYIYIINMKQISQLNVPLLLCTYTGSAVRYERVLIYLFTELSHYLSFWK